MNRMSKMALAIGGGVSLLMGLQGCVSQPHDEVGANAIMETSGDKVVSWTAPATGKLTVYDESSNKIVYGGPIMSGQGVKVDVDDDTITLDSQTVSQNALHRGDQYRIYFEPTGTLTRTSTVETEQTQTIRNP